MSDLASTPLEVPFLWFAIQLAAFAVVAVVAMSMRIDAHIDRHAG